MSNQPFYAVRVTLTYEDGGTVTRDYVRGQKRISRSDFDSFALGHLTRLCVHPGESFQWSLTNVNADEVIP